MKNGSIPEQIELQEQKIAGKKTVDVQTNENVKKNFRYFNTTAIQYISKPIHQ